MDSKNSIYTSMNRIIFYIVIFLNISLNISANPNLQARTGILIDYHSEEVLFELDPATHCQLSELLAQSPSSK